MPFGGKRYVTTTSRENNKMNEKTFLTDMEELLELHDGTVNCAVELARLETWNSLAFIGFLAMADSSYGVKIARRI